MFTGWVDGSGGCTVKAAHVGVQPTYIFERIAQTEGAWLDASIGAWLGASIGAWLGAWLGDASIGDACLGGYPGGVIGVGVGCHRGCGGGGRGGDGVTVAIY